MKQTIHKLTLGVTLSLACVACTSGGGSVAAHESASNRFVHLTQLKSVDSNEEKFITADEFPPTSGSPKVIGELRKGNYRLIAYVQGDSCGLRVAETTKPEHSLLHITSAWPRKDSEGSASYPAGPYSFASAAGANGSKLWASLACSKSAMVIEYSAPEPGAVSDQRGNVSIEEQHKTSGSLAVIVGSREARERISKRI
ncbi:hypothetical protein [Streptomyces achromogenes]|uniref:hypothetical protein n=1 Tax=Streptomyces achromogenes TaxID=67255 RepID=UPI003690B7BD